MRAYNDWLSEEYCSCAPERLIGVGVIPITNVDDAVAELEHCAKSGLKAVAIDSFPAGNRYPTPGDDRFWAAAVDLYMALTIHVEFGFPRRGRGQPAAAAGPSFKYPRQTDPEHHVPDVVERFNKYGFRGSKQVVQMIWGGVFERFPKLNIYVAEVQIGWVPNWMDQMDNEYGRQQYWAERVLGLPGSSACRARSRASIAIGASIATRQVCASRVRRWASIKSCGRAIFPIWNRIGRTRAR